MKRPLILLSIVLLSAGCAAGAQTTPTNVIASGTATTTAGGPEALSSEINLAGKTKAAIAFHGPPGCVESGRMYAVVPHPNGPITFEQTQFAAHDLGGSPFLGGPYGNQALTSPLPDVMKVGFLFSSGDPGVTSCTIDWTVYAS